MRVVGLNQKKLQLLRDITGAFRPGILTALMGVSGAGKTTLMDVLSGRKNGGIIEGDIRIGGYPKVQRTFARISGYCEQNDIHSPQITVKESVTYSAWLRLPPETDADTKDVCHPPVHLHNYPQYYPIQFQTVFKGLKTWKIASITKLNLIVSIWK